MNYDMRQIQMRILNIFIEIDDICKKNNLEYFAIGGTCLGAIRHKGFIPWDDDIDIAMPRNDYEEFKKIVKSQLPKYLQVFDVNQGEHYECMFIKVYDTNSTYIHKGMKKYKDRYTGVYVDIMPLDGLPNSRIRRRTHFLRLRNLLRLNFIRKFSGDRTYKKREMKSYIRYLVYKMISFTPANYFSEKYEKVLKKYPYENSRDTCYGWSKRAEKVVLSRDIFSDYIYVPFEDTKMRCPIGYDKFLKILFGDYMVLPPVENRVPVHTADIVDLERPYSYYLKEDTNE